MRTPDTARPARPRVFFDRHGELSAIHGWWVSLPSGRLFAAPSWSWAMDAVDQWWRERTLVPAASAELLYRHPHPNEWQRCLNSGPHAPHQMSYDPWRACPGWKTRSADA